VWGRPSAGGRLPCGGHAKGAEVRARLSVYLWVLAGVLILGSAVLWWAGSETDTEAKIMVGVGALLLVGSSALRMPFGRD